MTKSFALNSPEIALERFDDDIVLLSMTNGKYYNLAGSAVPCADAIFSGVDCTMLEDALGSSATQFQAVLEKLLEDELVRPAEPKSVSDDALQEIMKQITSADRPFLFECYDDMADLMAADPVHDVNPETGEIKIG